MERGKEEEREEGEEGVLAGDDEVGGKGEVLLLGIDQDPSRQGGRE